MTRLLSAAVALILLAIACIGNVQGRSFDGPHLDTFAKLVPLSSDEPLPASDPDLPKAPLPPLSDSYTDPKALIFVGIAHYRDQRCSRTLFSLFSKAKHPERLRIGLVQQIHTEADNFHCLQDFCAAYGKYCQHKEEQFRLLELTHQLARGPAYARYLQSTLIQDEDFCMQIDSHSEVVQDWDTKGLQMWGSAGNEYGVLSMQPPDVTAAKDSGYDIVPHLCQATFVNGQVSNLPPCEAHGLTRPLLSPLYSAAFVLGRCHYAKAAPADPNLLMAWHGEEFNVFARLWTRGYDTYTPSEVLVYHAYAPVTPSEVLPSTLKRTDALGRTVNNNPLHNVNSPLDWTTRGRSPNYRSEVHAASSKRMRALFTEGDAARTRWGLGQRRSLAQLMAFTGIDLTGGRVVADRCVQLHWVPCHQDQDPTVQSGDVWGQGPEEVPQGAANLPVLSSKELHAVPLAAYTSLSSAEAVVDAVAGTPEEVLVEEAWKAPSTPEEEAHVHRGGELWWMFQLLDSYLEDIITAAATRLGSHGSAAYAHRAVQLALALLPLFLIVTGLAIWLVLGGGTGASSASVGSVGRRLWGGSGLKRI